jgi:hypothetical protein
MFLPYPPVIGSYDNILIPGSVKSTFGKAVVPSCHVLVPDFIGTLIIV